MRTTVTIESEAVNKLLQETKAKSKTQAVTIAINDYLRRKKLDRIMRLKGRLDFALSAEELRHFER